MAIVDVLLVPQVDADRVVVALGIGNTVGMTVAGVLLVLAIRRAAGASALSGLARSIVGGLLSGAVAYAAGRSVV